MSVNSDKISKNYSKLRGRKFVFEGYADPSSYVDACIKAQDGIYGYLKGEGIKYAEEKLSKIKGDT